MKKIIIIMIFLTNITFARVGNQPPSQRLNLLEKQDMSLYQLEEVHIEKMLQKYIPQDYQPKPVKFAIGNDTKITTTTHGTWTDVPYGKIWNLRFTSKNATDINFGFTEFNLPKGVELYFMSFADDPVYYDGPYTSIDNKDYKQFWSAPLPGGDVALELFVPTHVNEEIVLELTKVSTGFRDVFKRYNGNGLIPKQGACNNDVICPEGDMWRDDIRAVAAYTINGTDTCTGTMVMDVEKSFTPYFLTAAHCNVTSGNAAAMVTIWNYESANCGDLSGGSRMDTVSGAIFKTRRSNVDVGLVELSSMPPEEYNVFWSGWDNSGSIPNGSVGIHHPSVDEKAISFNTDALTTINSCIGSGGVNSHWEVDNWEDGTTEPGSSGSGLWDPDSHLLVGFLSGGLASCSNINYDCYGKISEAWDDGSSGAAGNLKPWLDPNNTGLTFVEGSDFSLDPFLLSSDTDSMGVCVGGSYSSVITVESNDGYMEDVILSFSNIPNFVTNEALSSTIIIPTGTSDLTFDIIIGGTPGIEMLTIQAEGVELPGSTGLIFYNDFEATNAGHPTLFQTIELPLNYADAAPDDAILTAPVDLQTSVDVRPQFTWAAVPTAINYTLKVATDLAMNNIVYTTTVDSDILSVIPDSDLPSNIELFWRVNTVNTCDNTNSIVFSFTTIPLPGDCPMGLSVIDVNNYDFESGDQGWTHLALTGTADTWAVGTNNPHGGTNNWHANDVAEIGDQALVSPIISLPSGLSPLTFQFWNRQEMEASTNGCYDGGILEISTDGGMAFTQIVGAELLTDPYDGSVNTGFESPIGGQNAWCGDPQEYLNSIIDLDSYAGQNVVFRFRLATDESIGKPGWDIDDISIKGCGVIR